MSSVLRRPVPPLLLLVALLSAGPAGLRGAEDAMDRTARLATEWIKTRSETSRLDTEWQEQRELLQSMVAALNERARLADESVEEVKARTAQERAELDSLEAKNAAAQAALAQTEARLKATTAHLLALRPSLPPRLQAALALPYQSLQNPDLAVGDRMQLVMTVLNRCLQFNQVVTTGDEVLALPGERAPRSLEVAYWGLSHAYALDRAAGKAWFGAPGPAGWQWTPADPGVARDVARLLAMAADKSEPDFIVLPASLRHPVP